MYPFTTTGVQTIRSLILASEWLLESRGKEKVQEEVYYKCKKWGG